MAATLSYFNILAVKYLERQPRQVVLISIALFEIASPGSSSAQAIVPLYNCTFLQKNKYHQLKVITAFFNSTRVENLKIETDLTLLKFTS